MGQLPPLAPRAGHIQNSIHDRFLAMFVPTATPVAGRKVMFHLLPFLGL